MEGPIANTAAASADRAIRRRVYVIAAAALWLLAYAGSECIAVNAASGRAPHPMASNEETATNLKPSAPILDEGGQRTNSTLLIADASPEDRSSIRSAMGFDPALRTTGVEGTNAVTDATLSARSPTFYHQSIASDGLRLRLPPNNFEEDGPGTIKPSMAGLDVDSDRSIAGGRVRLVAADDERGRLFIETRLTWLFEYLQTDGSASAFFRPGDKGLFAVQGLGYGSNWAILGAGLRWELVAGWSAYAGYDAQSNRQQLFHIGSAGLDYAW